MTALLRAEARKALVTPTNLWLLLGTVAIGVVGTLAPLIAADDDAARLLTDEGLQEAMHGAAAGAVLVIVAGIINLAGEWRFGMATQTFLSRPRRRQVVAAKAAVSMVLGAVYGIAAAAGSTVTAWAWYRADGLALPFERSAVWLTLAGCVAVSVLFGLLGVALGAMARNQVLAIVAALGWMVVVEPALFAASPPVFRWLPHMASFSLRRQPTEGLLDPVPALVVLVGFIAATVVAGLRLVERDDVTS